MYVKIVPGRLKNSYNFKENRVSSKFGMYHRYMICIWPQTPQSRRFPSIERKPPLRSGKIDAVIFKVADKKYPKT